MADSSSTPLELAVCPDCGAANETGATQCWLCHASSNLFRDLPEQPTELPQPPAPKPARPALDIIFGVAFCTCVILVALLSIGIALDQPAGLIPFGMFVLPALLVVAVREARVRARGEVSSWSQRFLTLVVSGAITVGVASLLVVAAILGLMIYCFVALATNVR